MMLINNVVKQWFCVFSGNYSFTAMYNIWKNCFCPYATAKSPATSGAGLLIKYINTLIAVLPARAKHS
jgi:hypothetical protein